ncbi:MAG: type II secretion system F family protein [Patescibacteria group bacterium]
MKFSYTAKKASGEEYKSIIEAADKSDFFHELRKMGDTPIAFSEAKESRGFNIEINLDFLKRVKPMDKIIFARNISGMLDAGLSLSRALSVIERQTKNKKLKEIYKNINAGISGGKTFHESLATEPKVFSTLFISMVKAGEEGGTLAESLKHLASQMEKTYQIQKKVKGAMIYPGVILAVMVLIGVLMMVVVVPNLAKTFKELKTPLPTSTKIVIGLSDFASNHYILLILIIAALGAAFYYGIRTRIGKKILDFTSIRIPIIGTIIKESNSAQTTRTLSSLLSSGVDLVTAVHITGEVMQNFYYKEVLMRTEKIVEIGSPLSTIFVQEEKLYPIFVGEMMSVGEETGKLSSMLMGVASFYENEVEQKTKDMSTIVEPFLMVMIGAGVGFFAISMITPMYSVMNNI